MEKNAIERLLDENDLGTIVLYDENDKEVEFEQIAIIPYENEVYAILKPVEEMEGVADDEAIVFLLDADEESDEVLSVVEDEKIIDAIFDAYYKLLDEEGENNE